PQEGDDSGKKTVYRVALEKISKQVLPELDDAFAATVDESVKTVLELRLKIRELLEQEKSNARRTKTEAEILKVLVSKNEFLLPQIMVDYEIRNLLSRTEGIKTDNIDLEKLDVTPFREQLGGVASERVKASIIVDQIADQENLKVEKDDLAQWTTQMAEQTGLTEDQVRGYFSDQEKLAPVLMELRRKKVMEMLVGRTKVTLIEDEVAQPAETGKGKAKKPKAKKK
ncbi:MAG: hypothetical protein KDD53_08000, partial [Bdellovibrionales bacterium]|nr:hypothetical protein [Bdellovibrionales bacterium]